VSDQHFDANRSVWLADAGAYAPRPPLGRDSRVDVAIIGGGFTGVSTAYHLQTRFPDKTIAIFEARTIASGASGRNGGQMLNWVHGVDPEDPTRARAIYEATRAGIDTIESMIAEHDLDVRHTRQGHLDVFTDPRKAERAATAAERWNEVGLPVRFVDAHELERTMAFDGACGALLDPEGGTLDGAAFLRELRPVIEGLGVRVYESTPVTRIEEGREIELTTPDAIVRASAVVLATNAYTPHLGYFRSGIVPLHSHVIATEPAADIEWESRGFHVGCGFTDDRDRLSYGTLIAAGQGAKRLLFGGGSNDTYDYIFGNGTAFDGTSEAASRANQRQLQAYFPRLRRVAIDHRWSGPVALTLSRRCTIGVRGAHRNVYFAVGYSGHGVTMANLAGKVLTDIYSDSDEAWRGLPFYQHDLRYIPPEPFRSIGYHAYTRLTGRSPRSS